MISYTACSRIDHQLLLKLGYACDGLVFKHANVICKAVRWILGREQLLAKVAEGPDLATTVLRHD
jgi:hypothetical protein